MSSGRTRGLPEIDRSLIRIEAKLDTAISDHEQRLRRLERWMYGIPLGIAGGVATAVATFILR